MTTIHDAILPVTDDNPDLLYPGVTEQPAHGRP